MKRKLFVILLSIACIFCLAFGLSSCVANDGNGANGDEYIPAVTVGKRYNDNITYKLLYTSDEECLNGNIDNEKLHTGINFEVGKVYYMAVDFTISSFEMDGWEQNFTASFKIAHSQGMEARLEEVLTSNFSEKVEDGSTIITATYSIPENRTEPRTYRMLIRLILQSEKDYITTNFAFYGNNQSNYDYDEKLILLKVTEGLTYSLLDNKEGYAVGIGNYIYETDIFIPEYYNGLPVTAISYGGFQKSSITNIYISDTVTSIGEEGFYNCYDLKSALIPNSVTFIGDGAFEACWRIESIIIPNGVTSIGYRTFYDCYNLTSIKIPDSVTSIGVASFYHCTGLASITIPNSVISIGGSAFQYCTSLKSIIIPDGVQSIDGLAFENCTSLSGITIPNSITSIGDQAFENCTSLESIIIPNSVTSIGNYAFDYCTSLKSIIIPDSVTSIGVEAFSGTAYYNDTSNWENDVLYIGNHLIKAKTTLYGRYTIKSGTLILADYAFSGCRSLESIIIPDSVTSIGRSAFENCSSLTSITIGNGVTSIVDWAFWYCTSLESITIPDSVTSIGVEAFICCTRLKSVVFENTSGWSAGGTSISSSDLKNSATAAKYLTATYCDYDWERG